MGLYDDKRTGHDRVVIGRKVVGTPEMAEHKPDAHSDPVAWQVSRLTHSGEISKVAPVIGE